MRGIHDEALQPVQGESAWQPARTVSVSRVDVSGPRAVLTVVNQLRQARRCADADARLAATEEGDLLVDLDVLGKLDGDVSR